MIDKTLYDLLRSPFHALHTCDMRSLCMTDPDKLIEELREAAMERLRRFVGGESGYAVYPGGIFVTDGPSPFYNDLRALLEYIERVRGERDEAISDRNAHAEHVRRVAAEAEDGFAALEEADRCWEAYGVPNNRAHLTLSEQIAATHTEMCDLEARLQSSEATCERLRKALEEIAADTYVVAEGLSVAAGWASRKPDSDRARDKVQAALDASRRQRKNARSALSLDGGQE